MDQSNSTHNSDSLSGSSIQQSTTPQVVFLEALQRLPVLGLKLTLTPDILEKIEQLGAQQPLQNPSFIEQPNSNSGYYSSAKPTPKDIFIYQTTNKVKAENFPISSLKIGSWERFTRNEGDLVAKCYFAKRKLVWEFLENGLKRKIEIQWNDISSFKVSKQENQSAILEIELNVPPSFHHEIDPQPRKHTQWRIVSDFTGGQALTFRRHWLKLSAEVLDKPLEKLLKHDNRLCQLIQQGFPTLNSPYFDFSFDFDGKGYVNLEQQQQQFSFSIVPAANHHITQTYSNVNDSHHSSVPVMPLWDRRMNTIGDVFSHINYDQEYGTSDDRIICNQMPFWGQGMNNNVRDSTVTDQVGGMSFATTTTTTTSDFEMINPMNKLVGLDGLRSMSLNNSQIDFSNGIAVNELNNMSANYEPPNMIDNDVVVISNSLPSIDGSLEANSLSEFQVPYEYTSINMVSDNDMFYSSTVNSDPNMQYFSNFRSQ